MKEKNTTDSLERDYVNVIFRTWLRRREKGEYHFEKEDQNGHNKN